MFTCDICTSDEAPKAPLKPPGVAKTLKLCEDCWMVLYSGYVGLKRYYKARLYTGQQYALKRFRKSLDDKGIYLPTMVNTYVDLMRQILIAQPI